MVVAVLCVLVVLYAMMVLMMMCVFVLLYVLLCVVGDVCGAADDGDGVYVCCL